MCLGVPGQIVEIRPDSLGMTMGRVNFGGIVREVCLAYVPEAHVGDYVLVHVGFALSRLDEEEARRTLEALESLGEAAELRAPDGTGTA
jgi:hydrogenase expression/formation protein HypC